MLERSAGQHIPRKEEGLGCEGVLDIPVDSMSGHSFQELFVRNPIKLRGFGLRSLVDTIPAAFIGAAELSITAFPGQEGVCRQLEGLLGEGGEGDSWVRSLLQSDTRTGREFSQSWTALQAEGHQCTNFLGSVLEGTLARGPSNAEDNEPGQSSRQRVTEQREELREAVLQGPLLWQPDQTAHPTVT